MSGLDGKGTNFPNGIQTPFIWLNGGLIPDPTAPSAAIANIVAANGTAAAGANPTKAEYDVVVTLANELKTKLDLALAALRAHGIIDE
jgi:hypothetical protein